MFIRFEIVGIKVKARYCFELFQEFTRIIPVLHLRSSCGSNPQRCWMGSSLMYKMVLHVFEHCRELNKGVLSPKNVQQYRSHANMPPNTDP